MKSSFFVLRSFFDAKPDQAEESYARKKQRNVIPIRVVIIERHRDELIISQCNLKALSP